jgi:hypothetical protein
MADIKKISRGLYDELMECLEEFEEDVYDELEDPSTQDFSATKRFLKDYGWAAGNYLFYNSEMDCTAILKAVKSYPMETINANYRTSQAEFDGTTFLTALNNVIMKDFVQQNNDRFLELDQVITDVTSKNGEIAGRSKINYESIRRNRRRNTYR